MPFDQIVTSLADAFHAATAEVAAVAAEAEITFENIEIGVVDVTGLSEAGEAAAVEAASQTVVESASSGVDAAAKKARDRAHREHQSVFKKITKDAAKTIRAKLEIMIPGFGASLVLTPLLPESVLYGLHMLFAGFAMHLGIEGTEAMLHLMRRGHSHAPPIKKHVAGTAPVPGTVLGQSLVHSHNQKANEQEVKKKQKRAAQLLAGEMTAGICAVYDTKPVIERLTIEFFAILGMTFGISTLTAGLIQVEDWGQQLETWQPRRPLGRLLVKTTLPAHAGVLLQAAAPRIEQALPYMELLAFVTCGKVLTHVVPLAEKFIEDHIGTDLKTLPIRMAIYGWIGLVAGPIVYDIYMPSKNAISMLRKPGALQSLWVGLMMEKGLQSADAPLHLPHAPHHWPAHAHPAPQACPA